MFFYSICHLPVDSHYQHTLEYDVSHSISVPSGFLGPSYDIFYKAKLKSSDDRASPCFRPFWRGKFPDKCLSIQTLLYVWFKHILINLTSFMGTPKSMRILYNTSFLTEP
jgi:hypothetical protein